MSGYSTIPHVCSQTKPSETAHDSHVKLCGLSFAELIARAKSLHRMVAQNQRKERRYYVKKKNKQILRPKKITTQHLQTVLPK